MTDFDIDLPSFVIVNGFQGGGKSYLIKYLMYKYRKVFSYGLVFCNSHFDTNNSGFDYVPDEFIFPEYNEEALENLMNIQAKLVEKGITKHAYCILDDCLDDPKEFTSPVLKRLTTQCRHYNITVIFSTQYCNSLTSRMRTNAMSVFIFNSSTRNNTEALYNSYGQLFDNYNDFKTYLNSNLGDYKFIYYNKMKTKPSDKLDDIYGIYKAPGKIPNFKLKINSKLNK